LIAIKAPARLNLSNIQKYGSPTMPETGSLSSMPAGLMRLSPHEIRTLVLKLRWVGMDHEAEELAVQMSGVLPGLIWTDTPPTD
jgi:hypothetical protein